MSNAFQRVIKSLSGTTAADVDLIAAVVGKRIFINSYVLISVGTLADLVLFESNGVEIWRELLQGATGVPASARLSAGDGANWLFATNVSEKLNLNVNQTDVLHYSLAYFIE